MGKDLGRWAPLTGVLFAVIFLVAFLTGGSTPDSDASAQHAVSSYATHRSHDRLSLFLIAYASIFAMLFAAALRSYLKARSDGDGLITLGFGGMIIYTVGALTLVGMEYAATDVPRKIGPAAEQALNVLQNDVFFAFLVGTAIFLFGSGLAIVANAALPKWLGWIAVPLAVLAVTPLGWFVAIFALPIWAVILGVLMFMRSEAPAAAAAAPVAG